MLQGLKIINFLKIGDALVQRSILLEIGGARAYRMNFFQFEAVGALTNGFPLNWSRVGSKE